MTVFASLTLPSDASKLRFKEPFVSEAMNLKDAGVVPPGIFRGFTPSPQPNFILNFNVDAVIGDSVAVVETPQHYNLTARTAVQIVLDMTGQVFFPVYAVLRTEYGITPTPLAGFTSSKILIVKTIINNGDPQSLHTGDVKLCKILGFVGTIPNISAAVPSERQDNGGPLVTPAQLGGGGNLILAGVLGQTADFYPPAGIPTLIPDTFLAITSGAGLAQFNMSCTWSGLAPFFIMQVGLFIDGSYHFMAAHHSVIGSGGDFFFAITQNGSKTIPLLAGAHTIQMFVYRLAGPEPHINMNPAFPATVSVVYPAP